MKTLLLTLLLTSSSFATSQKRSFSDSALNDEFENVYYRIDSVLKGDVRISSLTVTTLNGAAYSAGGSPGQIPGTSTNDNAAAGNVGEYIESVVGATNSPATTVYGDLTSISLTAGDWDVSAMVLWDSNGGTWSQNNSGVSITSGNSSLGLVGGSSNVTQLFGSTSTNPLFTNSTISALRFSLSATTTIYLKFMSVFSAGTTQARGRLSARRVR